MSDLKEMGVGNGCSNTESQVAAMGEQVVKRVVQIFWKLIENGRTKYFVKWEGYPSEHYTWESKNEFIEEFLTWKRKQGREMKKTQKGNSEWAKSQKLEKVKELELLARKYEKPEGFDSDSNSEVDEITEEFKRISLSSDSESGIVKQNENGYITKIENRNINPFQKSCKNHGQIESMEMEILKADGIAVKRQKARKREGSPIPGFSGILYKRAHDEDRPKDENCDAFTSSV